MYTTLSPYHFPRVVSPGARPWGLVADAPKKEATRKILEQYLSDAHAIFSRKLEKIVDFQTSYDSEDQAKLASMLAIMLDARNAWEKELGPDTSPRNKI